MTDLTVPDTSYYYVTVQKVGKIRQQSAHILSKQEKDLMQIPNNFI